MREFLFFSFFIPYLILVFKAVNGCGNVAAAVDKARAIKSVPGWWNKVRDQYLKIKNRYLTQNDHDHPSFVCYVEAIHNVYHQMKNKKII